MDQGAVFMILTKPQAKAVYDAMRALRNTIRASLYISEGIVVVYEIYSIGVYVYDKFGTTLSDEKYSKKSDFAKAYGVE